MADEKLTLDQWHKKQAVALFNATWDLIDKKDKSKQDEINMIHTAHASRYHWGQIGAALEFARGEWQISRVYALLRQGPSALFHGQESLRLCTENNIGGFDLAFGYEAIARAYKVLDRRDSDIFKDKALEAAQKVEDKGDRDYTLSEINSI